MESRHSRSCRFTTEAALVRLRKVEEVEMITTAIMMMSRSYLTNWKDVKTLLKTPTTSVWPQNYLFFNLHIFLLERRLKIFFSFFVQNFKQYVIRCNFCNLSKWVKKCDIKSIFPQHRFFSLVLPCLFKRKDASR